MIKVRGRFLEEAAPIYAEQDTLRKYCPSGWGGGNGRSIGPTDSGAIALSVADYTRRHPLGYFSSITART